MVSSCGHKGKNIPDVSDIEIDFKINRFEQDLFKVDTVDFKNAIGELEQKYPEFSSIYFNDILASNDPRIAPAGPESFIKGFISDERINKLNDTCQIAYANFEQVEKQFEQAFKFYKHYFPGLPIPDVVTFISEYYIGVLIYGEDKLGVGLDFFLGPDYDYKNYNPGNPNFSDYLTRSFNKDHLVSKALTVLIEDKLGQPTGQRLLDWMVHNGKKRYILDRLLPSAPDSVIFEHTSKQMKWLEDNELEMWSYFIGEELLYSTNFKDIRKYIESSPASPGMPQEAPGNTGTWMGYKIVEAYMKKFPATSLPDLIRLDDSQKILTASMYKPKRK